MNLTEHTRRLLNSILNAINKFENGEFNLIELQGFVAANEYAIEESDPQILNQVKEQLMSFDADVELLIYGSAGERSSSEVTELVTKFKVGVINILNS